MTYIKYYFFLTFIFFNINSAIAVTISTETSVKSPQYNADLCGEKTCEFIFKEMKKFAKYGDPHAQAILALLYEGGIGTEANQNLSLKYVKRAANNGLSFAEYKLGMLYREKQLVGKFGRDADYWLTRAAADDFKPAIVALLSENKVTPENSNHYNTSKRAPVPTKDMEVIAVIADKFTLTDVYELIKRQGYGSRNQTGSRIKGRGCGNNGSPCDTVDLNTDIGAVQYLLFTMKINR